jgi:hypothetical protein
MPLFAAQFFIQSPMVNDVVAVSTAGGGLQVWTVVYMADSQLRQVRYYPGTTLEPEIRRHLNSVRANDIHLLPFL